MHYKTVMRKSAKKVQSPKRKILHTKTKSLPFVLSRILIITFALLIVIIGIKTLSSLASTIHVLGVASGPVLADKGSGDNGLSDSSSGGDSTGVSGGSSGGSPSTSGSSLNGGDNRGGSSVPGIPGGDTQAPVSQDTQVDCVGPNGVHFTTSFHDCQEFNQKWNNSNFHFIPLANHSRPVLNSGESEQPSVTPIPHSQLEMQTEGKKGEITMENPGLHVEVKREDNGIVKLTAKKGDGTEVELSENALEEVNKALEDKGVEVATSASSPTNLVLRQKGVEAETELPISVNPSTHELTVTTSSGVKTIAVLPDQAVQNLLNNKVLSSVETQVSSPSGSANEVSTLTELRNQPVFAVNGVTQKNLFGLFPVGFAKTAFVSATNGTVVQVNESLLNKVLEALSF